MDLSERERTAENTFAERSFQTCADLRGALGLEREQRSRQLRKALIYGETPATNDALGPGPHCGPRLVSVLSRAVGEAGDVAALQR